MAILYTHNAGKAGHDEGTDSTPSSIPDEQMDKRIIKGIKEVSGITGLSMYAIRKGIAEGIFPAFQVSGGGGKYFIDINEFQAAIRDLGRRSTQHYNDDTNVVSINGIRRVKE